MASIDQWVKLRELSAVMDSPMSNITSQWEDGHLAGCHFTQEEVANLVYAIFEPTNNRKACLERINNCPAAAVE
eukprot:5096394-Pyramimonas_sp.AAC.1